MFDIIKEKMRDFIKNERLGESEIRDEEMEDVTIRLANMQLAGELIRMINLNRYDKKVLKYVAPYFNLNINDFDDDSNSETGSEIEIKPKKNKSIVKFKK